MQIKQNIIITALVAAVLGLLIGLFLFDRPAEDYVHSEAMESTVTQSAGEIWTCSMHPQVRQDQPGQCPICGMDLIPLDESSSGDPLVLQMTPEAVRLASIQTSVVGDIAGEDIRVERLTGKVRADERRTSSQVAHVPGRIEKLFVTFTGEQVRDGQKLAELYSPELIAAQRELFEALRMQDVSPQLLKAARAKLRYWKIDSTTIHAIEQRGTIQETFPLYASASGVVMKRNVAIGDYVKQGEPLFELVNLDVVWVLFDAYEEDLGRIAEGDRVVFTTPAVPGRTFTTRVSFIDPVINAETRAASVRAEVENSRGLLKPEMLVYGEVRKRSGAESKLTVPKSAVMWTGKRSVVYVEQSDMIVPSYAFREVTLGDAVGDSYVILDGLSSGEKVVTHGSFTIDAAAQLNNQASMINRKVVLKGSGATRQTFASSTPEQFKEQLTHVVQMYLELSEALVGENTGGAATAAGKFVKALDQTDMSLLLGESHDFWMKQLKAMKMHGNNISKLDDIRQQREQFEFASMALIQSLRAFGIAPGATLYIQHCPMAFNNQGADWVSDEQQIRNPYFGDRMLKCGSVTDTLEGEKEKMQ